MAGKKYQIRISATAEKQLKAIPSRDRQRIVDSILALSVVPFPRGAKKLTGYDDTYRVRVGNYRVIYIVDGKVITITVLKIGHRKDVYRS